MFTHLSLANSNTLEFNKQEKWPDYYIQNLLRIDNRYNSALAWDGTQLNNPYQLSSEDPSTYKFITNSPAIHSRDITRILKVCKEKAARLNKNEHTGEGLLHTAAQQQVEDEALLTIVDHLLKADCNPADMSTNQSPLSIAASNGHSRIVQKFIDKLLISDPISLKRNGGAALISAISNNHRHIVDLLLNNITIIHDDTSATLLCLAVSSGYNHGTIKRLIDQICSTNPHALQEDGLKALYTAVSNKKVDVARLLLKKVDISQHHQDRRFHLLFSVLNAPCLNKEIILDLIQNEDISKRIAINLPFLNYLSQLPVSEMTLEPRYIDNKDIHLKPATPAGEIHYFSLYLFFLFNHGKGRSIDESKNLLDRFILFLSSTSSITQTVNELQFNINSDENLQSFSAALKTTSNMRALKIFPEIIDIKNTGRTAFMLGINLNLRILDLSNLKINHSNVSLLNNFIKNHSQLEHIFLNNTPLGSGHTSPWLPQSSIIEILIPALGGHSHLCSLELNNVGLNAADVSVLIEMIDPLEVFDTLSYNDNPLLNAADVTLIDKALLHAGIRKMLLDHVVAMKIMPELYIQIENLLQNNLYASTPFNNLTEAYANFSPFCNIIEQVSNAFIPLSDALKKKIKNKKDKAIKMTGIEPWQAAADTLKTACQKAKEEVLQLNVEKYSYADCLIRVQSLHEKLVDFIGHAWLVAQPPSSPLFKLSSILETQAIKLKVGLANIPSPQLLGYTTVENFGMGLCHRLEGYYIATAALESGLIKRDSLLTLEEHHQEKAEHVLTIITEFTVGIIAFASLGAHIPILGSVLTTLGITKKILNLLDNTGESWHLLDLFPLLKEKAAHSVVHLVHKLQKQYSLSPDILCAHFRQGFKDSRDFKHFKELSTLYFTHRYQHQAELLNKHTAYALGQALAERVAEPFMLGLQPWLMQQDAQHVLKVISAWVYYASTLPFLMKRRMPMPVFKTRRGESITLDAILAPAGFCCLDENGQKIFIEVEPLNRVLSSSLQSHLGGKENHIKPESTAARLTGYCLANEQETHQLNEQLREAKNEEYKAVDYIANQGNQYASPLFKEMADHNMIEQKSYSDALMQVQSLAPQPSTPSKPLLLPFVIKSTMFGKTQGSLKQAVDVKENDLAKTKQINLLSERANRQEEKGVEFNRQILELINKNEQLESKNEQLKSENEQLDTRLLALENTIRRDHHIPPPPQQTVQPSTQAQQALNIGIETGMPHERGQISTPASFYGNNVNTQHSHSPSQISERELERKYSSDNNDLRGHKP